MSGQMTLGLTCVGDTVLGLWRHFPRGSIADARIMETNGTAEIYP